MTNAQKRILEQFKIAEEGVTFCPYLKCSGEKDPHVYWAKDLWLEMCEEFKKQYES